MSQIVPSHDLHCRWLNTLSCMEHVGATRIATTQHGPGADFMVLKHSAEEARHAFFLKWLLRKLDPEACPTYAPEFLLAPRESSQYIRRLDLGISRAIIAMGIPRERLHEVAYLLVTYAIEVRADEIYPIYQEFLQELPQKLSVHSIIAEEEGHLQEMENSLATLPVEWQTLKQNALKIEENLYTEWLLGLEKTVKSVKVLA